MIDGITPQKQFTYRDVLTLFIIVFAAATLSITENDTFLLVLTACLLLYGTVQGYLYEANYFYLTIAYWALMAAIALTTSGFDLKPTGGYFLRITSVYLLLRMIGPTYFVLIEKWFYWLSLFSLPMFAIQLVAYDFIQSLARIFNFEHGIRLMGGAIDWIFFHVDGWAPTRNAGFMWEPGSFGMMIVIGMLLNFYFNDDKYFLSKRNLIYILAILSTQSTTAYLNVFILLHFYLLNSKDARTNFLWLLLPVIYLGAVVAFFSLDFLGPKIDEYFNSVFQYKEFVGDTTTIEGEGFSPYITVGRFSMLVIDLQDWLKSPIVGLGFSYDLRTDALFQKFSRVNGLSDYIATFGLVGIAFMGWALQNMFRIIELQSGFKSRFKSLGYVIMLTGLFSNPVVNNFFTLSWLMFALVNSLLLNYKLTSISSQPETAL